MAFIPVPNTVAVDVIYEWDSQVVENTLYFTKTGSWTVEDLNDLLGSISTTIQSTLLPLLSNTLKLVRLTAQVIDAADGLFQLLNISPPATGSGGDRPVPNNVTFAVQFKTGLAGRSFSGRNYVPGLLEEDVTSNDLNAGTRVGLLDFYTTMGAATSELNFTHVVVSRYSGVDPDTGKPIPRVTGVATPVSAYTTYDAVVDSQRRRLPGRGK
jgi:hypothetical protein